MPEITIDLDRDTYRRLVDLAVSECRPIPWQAEVTLRRGLPTEQPFATFDKAAPVDAVPA
jgi:hypothetical protein